MRTYAIVLALVAFVSPRAHAGKVDLGEADNKVTKAGVITLSADWLKDKGKKYDIGFKFKSEHKEGMLVKLSDVSCFRGDIQGELDSDKTLEIRPNQFKHLTLTCKLSDKASGGAYRLVVSRVYENVSGDGKTLGKVLAQDITWQVKLAN